MKMFLAVLLLIFSSVVVAQQVTVIQYAVIIPQFKSDGTAKEAFDKLQALSKEHDPDQLGIKIIFNETKPRGFTPTNE